jgi:hypothetical protein
MCARFVDAIMIVRDAPASGTDDHRRRSASAPSDEIRLSLRRGEAAVAGYEASHAA